MTIVALISEMNFATSENLITDILNNILTSKCTFIDISKYNFTCKNSYGNELMNINKFVLFSNYTPPTGKKMKEQHPYEDVSYVIYLVLFIYFSSVPEIEIFNLA